MQSETGMLMIHSACVGCHVVLADLVGTVPSHAVIMGLGVVRVWDRAFVPTKENFPPLAPEEQTPETLAPSKTLYEVCRDGY